MKRWIIHATAQNVISLLPKSLSYKVYFWVQRKFGRLQSYDSLPYIEKAIRIEEHRWKHNIGNDLFFELGTGRTVTTLIGLWFLGYKRMITVDLNPYLSEEMTKGYIRDILKNQDKLKELLKPFVSDTAFQSKIEVLRRLLERPLPAILSQMNIEYLPKKDARFLDSIEDGGIDIYFSDQVLEHIPPEVLKEIMLEGKKKLKEEGVFLHYIGLHDHFASIDSSISKVNFLRFSSFAWRIIAGNRFMYHNRLRASDFDRLFNELQLRTIDRRVVVDERSLDVLNKGFKVIIRFKAYNNEDLAVGSMDVVLIKL